MVTSKHNLNNRPSYIFSDEKLFLNVCSSWKILIKQKIRQWNINRLIKRIKLLKHKIEYIKAIEAVIHSFSLNTRLI